MSVGLSVSEDDVFEICKKAYINNNKVLKFNKHTNPRNTYTWRAIKILTNKFNKCGLRYEQIDRIIDAGLEIAKNDNSFTLYRFNDSGFITECCNRAITKESHEKCIVNDFGKSHQWVLNNCGQNVYNNLLKKTSLHGMTNIAMWYKSNFISDYYIALSADCSKAVESLAGTSDANFLPSLLKLESIRKSVSPSLFKKLSEAVSQQ